MRKRLVFLALLLGVWIGCGDTGDWTLSPQTAEYIEESCPKGMPLSYCTMLRKGISAMIATDDPGCSKHGNRL